MHRRKFLTTALTAPLATHPTLAQTPVPKQEPTPTLLPAPPLRVGHRQTQLATIPGPSVFQLAKSIPGLSGVELQVIWKNHDLTDPAIAFEYKRAAYNWAVEVPSISGIWRPGELITDTPRAEAVLLRSLPIAHTLGASNILVALFTPNCPDMATPASYEPVVALLQRVAPHAAALGITFALETSLTPADDRRLITLVNHPAIRIYYDAANVEKYHPGQSLAGIDLLAPFIAQAHLKNETRLLSQSPSPVDWPAALHAYKRIGFNGWFFLETEHSSPQQCIDATIKNLAFIRQVLA